MTLSDIDLTTPWKERDKIDKADAVRQLIERDGLTTGQAARILHTSRNSVIGVSSRLQKATDPDGPRHQGARKDLSRSSALAKRQRNNELQAKKRKNPPKPTATPKLNQLPPVPDRAWIALEGSTPKPLAEHRHGECLWPLYDHPMLFCCLPIDPGSQYCPTHRALGFRALPAKGTAQ